MKTDTLFYRLFQEFPAAFFELIGQPPETANGYTFDSIELKQTAFRLDGLFLPTSQAPDQLIYAIARLVRTGCRGETLGWGEKPPHPL